MNWQFLDHTFWQTLITIIAVVAAYLIGKKQIKIQDFAEIFIRPNKLPDSSWELQIRNGSSRIIYITKIEITGINPESLKISRGKKLSLPTGENNYYSIIAPEHSKVNDEIRIDIEFEDNIGGKYKSHHVAWFQGERWGMQNLKAENI